MENASKALIIAGAILLAIVIISLGLVVVNNTRSTVDNANLNEKEIETFNNKFVAYEGSHVKGAKVKTLLQVIQASNAANPEHQVTPSGVTDGSTVVPNAEYTVVLGYGSTAGGYVDTIAISKN